MTNEWRFLYFSFRRGIELVISCLNNTIKLLKELLRNKSTKLSKNIFLKVLNLITFSSSSLDAAPDNPDRRFFRHPSLSDFFSLSDILDLSNKSEFYSLRWYLKVRSAALFEIKFLAVFFNHETTAIIKVEKYFEKNWRHFSQYGPWRALFFHPQIYRSI